MIVFNLRYTDDYIVRVIPKGTEILDWVHSRGQIRRYGYTLAGFTTDPEGEEVEVTEMTLRIYTITEDTTFYPVWKLGEDTTISGNEGYTVSGNWDYTVSGNEGLTVSSN